jgi:uncharacterized RDD family membrane protein YckC
MFCTNCGTKNTDIAGFCKKCGKELIKEDLNYAGFWVRFGAYFIDFIGMLASAMVLAFFAGMLGLSSFITQIGGIFDYACWIIYSTLCLSIWSNTPGKAVYGLKVLKEDGEKLDFKSAFSRAFWQPWSLLFVGAGYWNLDKNEKKQAWHDKNAHTVVIQKKGQNYILPVILTIVGLVIYFYLRSLETAK